MIKCGHKNCNSCNTDGYEWADRVFLYRFLATHGDSVFIDVGAHVGLYVNSINQLLHQNEAYKATCRMLSIEPDMEVATSLYHNTIPHTVMLMAAWHKNGALRLVKEGRAHGSIALELPTSKELHTTMVGPPSDFPVPGVTVDLLTMQLDLVADTLAMKIDVEGAELFVIEGAIRTLHGSSIGALVIELSNEHLEKYGVKVDAVMALLDDLRYRPVDARQISDVNIGHMRNVHFTKENSK